MINRAEGYFLGDAPKSASSARIHNELFYQSWTNATGKARATLVLTHGIAEHSEAYNEFALQFAPRGWDIYAMDLRGHGRSEGRRGYIDDFHRYSRDLDRFVRHLRAGPLKNSKLPIVMMGHSMGGLITLRYMVDQGEAAPASALVLSSPALGISMPIPPVKEMAASLLLKFLPQVTLPNDIRYDHLTHIEERWKRYPVDPLRHDKISPAMYFGMLEGFEKVNVGANRIKVPTLIQAAGDERIVSRPAIEEYFPKIGADRKKLIIYENSFHEIFNDIERERAMDDLDAFLGLVLPGSK
jgi:alpha-beta hydrolase superfamily lysophospholipase